MSTIPTILEEDLDDIVIEATAKVYLEWDDALKRWTVSSSTMDGYALDSTDDDYGNYVTSNMGGPKSGLPAEKQAEWERAERAPFPTGKELIELMQEAAGWR